MGAGVSAGENNDDLVDKLKRANYLKTSLVEQVFRAVDRGAYFLPDPPVDAYRDVAWKNGNFHISAPCIYSEVMEGLKLKPGMSFLNLGSGTGYLNTVAGLILGSYGINHGIELYDDVIQYAYMRLEDFKRHSGALDEYDFCEPKFMQGNCLRLASGYYLYDRVYCGAACPEKYLNYMKNLIKVGGILVIPVNERLVEMKRVTETNWTTQYLLPVSFTNLVKPEKGTQEVVPLFDIEPLNLQELCRTTIRNLLRKIIEIEHPSVKNIARRSKPLKKKKAMKRDRNGRKDTPRTSEELLDFFLLTIARKKKRVNAAATQDRENSERSASSSAYNDDGEDTEDPSSSDSDDSSLDDPLENVQNAINVLQRFKKSRTSNNGAASTSNNNETEEACSSGKEVASSMEGATSGEIEREVIVHRENVSETESNEKAAAAVMVDKTEENKVSYNITVEPMVIEEDISEEMKEKSEEGDGEAADSKGKSINNRNKFDSGLGDELPISELPVDMVGTMTSSSDDEQDNRRCKRGKEKADRRLNSKWRKIDKVDVPKNYSDSDDGRSDSENNSNSESEYVEAMNRMKMYISPYTVHMRNKIQELPLPSNIKKFLNYYREF